MGATCHQGVTRTCSEKIRNSSSRDKKMRSSVRSRPTMVKSSTVASSTPSQSKSNSKSVTTSATSSPHQSKQQQAIREQLKPNQNQLRRKLSRKLELMPQLDWRAFQGSGVTKLWKSLSGQSFNFCHLKEMRRKGEQN